MSTEFDLRFIASLIDSSRGERISASYNRPYGRYYRRSIPVPTGKSALLKLMDDALAAPSDSKLLVVRSDREGVDWWPIDSATPEVNEDTSAFGWQLDLNAEKHYTGHSVPALSAQSHNSGLMPSGNSTPYWMGIDYDRDNWQPVTGDVYYLGDFVEPDQFTTDSLTAPASSFAEKRAWVFHQGLALPMQLYKQGLNWPGAGMRRVMRYCVGIDNRFNFGSDNDDLQLYVTQHVRDFNGLQVATFPAITLYCYPFTDTLWSPYHIADFANVWTSVDPHLCSNHSSGYSYTKSAKFVADRAGDGVSLVNGTQVWTPGAKSAWTATVEALDGGYDNGGSPVWHAITSIDLSVTAKGGANVEGSIPNVYFGPKAGLRRTLRPFEASSHQWWSGSSIPAIGIQNNTGNRAVVEAFLVLE